LLLFFRVFCHGDLGKVVRQRELRMACMFCITCLLLTTTNIWFWAEKDAFFCWIRENIPRKTCISLPEKMSWCGTGLFVAKPQTNVFYGGKNKSKRHNTSALTAEFCFRRKFVCIVWIFVNKR